ncbi:MAG TPA: serine/threonine-protein kinase [Pirellulales bacterium]|jgi:serine/threonine protein kinase/tetratricopeptide (TPR) repeat protein
MMIPISEAKEIFGRAIELERGAARTAFLDGACDGSRRLRQEIDELISAWEGAGSFLNQSAAATVVATFSEDCALDRLGTVIGRYKLLEQIGDGGMGVVFMAEQQVPMRRRVALKIIKPGMDTRQVIARFDAERQALALMDHPNIARALDAGMTESGRPYFVMELVRGIPITDYADKNRLSISVRLQLFVQVCHAVQHAHQNGIIHRDLKPTNVLVTLHDGVGVPKVIDFGVAKATNGQLTDKTLVTNFSQMIGTPSYMSPEQAEMSGLDVDTRSDIYSLGVLLYELLTGTTPFDKTRLHEASYDEMRRIIREEEPITPSSLACTLGRTATSLAAGQDVDPGSYTRLLRGDLDWIVMKALEKDRARRYPTANELARDVERHLRDEPIDARPPSAAYRFRTFARRNRGAIITTTVVVAALVAGTITSTWQAIRARQAEAIAEAGRNEAEVQRRRAEVNFQKARQAVDKYVASVRDSKLLSEETHQPLRKELIESTLAYYRQFVEQYQNDPTLQPELGSTYVHIGQINNDIGSKEQACEWFRKGVDVYQRLCCQNPDNVDYQCMLVDALNGSAAVLRDSGHPVESARASQRSLEICKILCRDHPGEARYAAGLAQAEFHCFLEHSAQHAMADAETSIRRVLALCETLSREQPGNGDYRADLARAHVHFGNVQRATNRTGEAAESFRQAAEIYEQLAVEFGYWANYRRAAAQAHISLGDVYRVLGRKSEAMWAFLAARTAFQELARQTPPDPAGRTGVGRANFRIGVLQAELGEKAAAEKSWTTATADFDVAVCQENPPISALAGLSAALAMQGNWARAAAAGIKVVDASGRSCDSLAELSLLQLAADDESGYRTSCSELVSRFSSSASDRDATSIIATCVAGDAATTDMSTVLALSERMTASDPGNPIRRALLGAASWRAGQIQRGTEILERALPLCEVDEKRAPASHERFRAAHVMSAMILAKAYYQSGNQQLLSAQIDLLRELVARYEKALPEYDEESPRWLAGLALELARRELSRMDDLPHSAGKPSAE